MSDRQAAIEAATTAVAAFFGPNDSPEDAARAAIAAYEQALGPQVPVAEVERWLRRWQDDWREGAMVPPPADDFLREFSERREG